MKMFMQHHEQPGRTDLCLRVLRLNDHDHGRRSEGRKCCQEPCRKLPWSSIDVIAHFLKLLWRIGIMGEELRLLGHQQQWSRRLAPPRPDPILHLGGKTVELMDAYRVRRWDLRSGALREKRGCG